MAQKMTSSVFLAEDIIEYEGPIVIGVFSTMANARRYCEKFYSLDKSTWKGTNTKCYTVGEPLYRDQSIEIRKVKVDPK